MAQVTRQSKMCLKCRQVRPIIDFYKNNGWKEQKLSDVYCKECAKAMVHNKEDVRRYFWENNRLWNERIWEAAKKKAMYTLASNPKYIGKSLAAKERMAMENDAVAKACLTIMNLKLWYAYSPNISEDAEEIDFDPLSKSGMVVEFEDGTNGVGNDTKVYSLTWNGYYTQDEIAYMDNYYSSLEKEFSLEDIAMRDSARKCAKASMLYDTIFNRYRDGKAGMDELKAAQKMFDDNLKTANFAACKRNDTNSGDVCIGEIVRMIEEKGLLQTTSVEWDADAVDAVLADLYHTAEAIGEEE
jgi:hypothetical protein